MKGLKFRVQVRAPFDPSTKLRVVSLSNHRLRTGGFGFTDDRLPITNHLFFTDHLPLIDGRFFLINSIEILI